jgi:GDPmannose 4,6-dehydratase
VQVDQAYVRPADVPDLRGDSSKARARLGWRPTISFEELIREMLEHDLADAGLNPSQHLKAPAPPQPTATP